MSRNLLIGGFTLACLAVAAAVWGETDQASASQLWLRLMAEIQALQKSLHGQLAAAVRAVHDEQAGAAWGMAGLGFLYGIFHAAGPGHGKAVVAAYLATHEGELRRGILLSVLSAVAQGVTAVVLVEITVGLLGMTMRQAQAVGTTAETLSYLLVALLGVFLVYSNLRRLRADLRFPPGSDLSRGHAHDHHHRHEHGGGCSACGHVHAVTPGEVGRGGVLRLIGVALSIGARPCSGAILVLLVAHALELRWTGIIAVFAMSLGTAITVSALAILSVYARRIALALVGSNDRDARPLALTIDVLGLTGGLIILVFGGLLFAAAMTAPRHPLF